MSELTSQIANELAKKFSNPNAVKVENLNDALRLLSKWRSVLIQNTLLNNQGTKVLQGPFSGMEFLSDSAEGCHVAKLLGCYEQPLQPFIERVVLTL